ncbi:MFS transporter [Chitinophaga filiformis]|uniref:Drug resistance transporter, EmrB/QacA subfamily n=1 Tax=Chitinophaga filiformis TaxID=104663 RepID=A0A1G7NQ08_CHIFI|nr:MFS transporter [Chitinophaga filiformis]SDF76165.1 drug resistance transporter, EmrB/QacA subfamily [Chitinophaga filiformis]
MTAQTKGQLTNKRALIAICLAALMFGLEITSVPVILPTLEKALGSNFSQLQWIMNAYTIACTMVLMGTGTLADRFGRKRVFIANVIGFGITSIVCGIAGSTELLIASRFFQGMTGGAMFICTIALLSYQYPEGPQRSKAFAAWGIIAGIGLGFGPIIGSIISETINWRWVFLIHGALALSTILLIIPSIQESKDPNAGKLDVTGMLLLSAAVFALTYYITQGPENGFTSTSSLLVLLAAVVLIILFVLAEVGQPYPMIDFKVFRVRQFTGAIMGCIGMNFSFWPLMVFLPLYFQVALHCDTLTTGMCLLAYTLPTLLFPPIGERLMLRYGAGWVIPGGLLLIGTGFFVMYAGSSIAGTGWLALLPGCILAGSGLGIVNTPVTNTATGAVPGDRAGMASGIDVSCRLITLAINIALMGFLLVQGTFSYLSDALPLAGTDQLFALSKQLVAGSVKVEQALNIETLTEMHQQDLFGKALQQGFGRVFLYGGTGVSVLALISFLIFNPQKRRKQFADALSIQQVAELSGDK